MRNATFGTTLLQVCLSVYEDLDESVIALTSGDYFDQIGKIFDGIGRQKQADPHKLNCSNFVDGVRLQYEVGIRDE